MLAVEHSHQQHHFAQPFGLDSSFDDFYPELSMNSYSSFDSLPTFAPLPFSTYENPSFYVDTPPELFKSDMHRSSSSNGSLRPASHHSSELPPSTLSSASGQSIPSASSSTVGSPYSGHAQSFSHHESWVDSNEGLGLGPAIVNHEAYYHGFIGTDLDGELTFGLHDKLSDDFVDPALIQAPRTSMIDSSSIYAENATYPPDSASYQAMSSAASPVPSLHEHTYPPYQSPHMSPHFSPAMAYSQFPQHPEYDLNRRSSISSFHSKHSHDSSQSGSADFDEHGNQKGRCPNLDCGKVYKDLKAHMLTHQSERPEKCPILTCEYNQKGFARKYDRSRHTLTHYKGTMICGFCPGSGSTAEKSFNRADVFKRHLTSVHGVEQAPPNSRKRSPTASTRRLTSYCEDATGKCSTCSATFTNAQDFYEHLDDCVLRIVQQEEPSEAHNQRHLAAVAHDSDVKETMERNHIPSTGDESTTIGEDDVDEEEEDEDEEDDDPSFTGRSGRGLVKANKAATGARAVIGSCVSKPGRAGRKGLTYSKGGVPMVGKGRKKRKHYPSSWGMSAEKMQMKKRVLCVYDGERRLWKDDMMMHNEFEVRMKLADGKSYVTDLDVETLKRAEAFHNATETEKGPWPQYESNARSFDHDKLDELMS